MEGDGRKFVSDSGTSEAAADAIEPKAGTLRAEVLAAIRAANDGLTDHEMQSALAMNPSTQRPRRVELVEHGLVVDSGRTRCTPSGRQAVVWIVAPKQLEMFA